MISLQDRELTKAASIRADFARDLEEVTSWLGGAEARVLDRGAEPAALKVNKLHLKVNKQLTSAKVLISLKERLAEVSCEIGAKTEQVERLNKNGQSLAERWVSCCGTFFWAREYRSHISECHIEYCSNTSLCLSN